MEGKATGQTRITPPKEVKTSDGHKGGPEIEKKGEAGDPREGEEDETGTGGRGSPQEPRGVPGDGARAADVFLSESSGSEGDDEARGGSRRGDSREARETPKDKSRVDPGLEFSFAPRPPGARPVGDVGQAMRRRKKRTAQLPPKLSHPIPAWEEESAAYLQ